MPENFARVTENIYRGGAPSATDLKMLRDIYKIRKVISLDADIGAQIAPTLKAFGIQHIVIPVSASETGMTDVLKNLVRNVNNLLGSNQPVYVHCRYGSDRTGLAVALYRVNHDNWKCEQALAEARRFGFGAKISPGVQNLYKKIICGFTADTNSVNDGDIVQEMRDTFQMGNVAPAFNPQQSWAPQTDIRRETTSLSPVERKQLLQEMSDEISQQVPQVGTFDNWSGVRGVGPVETGGFLQL